MSESFRFQNTHRIFVFDEFIEMLMSSIFLVVLLAVIMSFSHADTPCCISCVVAGEEKYYSIDTRHNSCGECCMNPDDYDVYKKYEPGLEKANSSTPCLDLKYPNYIGTETHGFGSVKMTLDLYDPSKK